MNSDTHYQMNSKSPYAWDFYLLLGLLKWSINLGKEFSLHLASCKYKSQILLSISEFGRRSIAIEFIPTFELLGRNKNKQTYKSKGTRKPKSYFQARLTGEKWLIFAYQVVPWLGPLCHVTSLCLDFLFSFHSPRCACSASALVLSLAMPPSCQARCLLSTTCFPNPVQALPLHLIHSPPENALGRATWAVQRLPSRLAMWTCNHGPSWGGDATFAGWHEHNQ